MFVDSTSLTLSAGKGGNGVVAWRREKFIPKGGPTGGDGGRGGSVYLVADTQTVSLEGYRNRRLIVAQNGACGGSNYKIGKSGKDQILKVPCGTLVKDKNTGEILFDLVKDGEKVLLCKGGKPGKGNDNFKSPTNQAPNIFTEGTPGETKDVELELKLIADVGLVGMPNAGKSTLISTVCYTRVKIGAYPFTTLFPNLGYLSFPGQERLLLADIPGIIEGAHTNKGLGIAFLKHVERTSLLIFVIDISGFEQRDPLEDFRILKNELVTYKNNILDKPFLVALNKMDAEGAEENIERFYKEIDVPKDCIFTISAQEKIGLSDLMNAAKALSDKVKPIPEEPEDKFLPIEDMEHEEEFLPIDDLET
jgi:GTPase